jgi:hypothetical protein
MEITNHADRMSEFEHGFDNKSLLYSSKCLMPDHSMLPISRPFFACAM